MRKSIQPEYYQATVTCNCGNTFEKFNKKYGIDNK